MSKGRAFAGSRTYGIAVIVFMGVSAAIFAAMLVYLVFWFLDPAREAEELNAVGAWGLGVAVPAVGATYVLRKLQLAQTVELHGAWSKAAITKGPSVNVRRERLAKDEEGCGVKSRRVMVKIDVTPSRGADLYDLAIGFVMEGGGIVGVRTDVHLARPQNAFDTKIRRDRESGGGEVSSPWVDGSAGRVGNAETIARPGDGGMVPYSLKREVPKRLVGALPDATGIEAENLRAELERSIKRATIASFMIDGHKFIVHNATCWPEASAPRVVRRDARRISKAARAATRREKGYARVR